MKRSHHALDDVVDVGVIPSGRSIAILVDRLAGVNAASKLMDGQVRSLPRAVDREETQRDHPQLIKMRVGGTKKFAGDFCGRIWAYGLGEMEFFGKRNGFRNAVNRRTRRKDKPLDSNGAGGLQQVQRSTDVRIVIKLWLLNRRSNPRASREMRDRVEFLAMKKGSYRSRVAQVNMVNGDLILNCCDICMLYLWIVKIVEVVENGNVVSRDQQLFREMRTDKTRAAGNQNSHGASVKMKRNPSKGRSRLAFITLLAGLFLIALIAPLSLRLWPELTRPIKADPAFRVASAIELASLPTATRFDFPLGTENGGMAYNAQPFTENRHLGDDLNGIGGENSDLGDPVFAIAMAASCWREGGAGWGNVIILLHAYAEGGERKYVQSYYGHVQTMLVKPKQEVKRGQQIATVGSANGRYLAHLHFEMREFTTPFIGPGYRADTRGLAESKCVHRQPSRRAGR